MTRTPEQILIDKERLSVSPDDKKRFAQIWATYVGDKAPLTTINVMRFAKAIELSIRESIFGKGSE